MEKDSRKRKPLPVPTSKGANGIDHPRSPDDHASSTVAAQPASRDTPGNEDARKESLHPSTMAPRRLRVCVVEDSYKNMRVIFRALKENGHDVDHFSQSADAITALESGSYDAVIVSDTAAGGPAECDALIARLRLSGRQEFTTLPIVALTTDESGARRNALQLAGASEVLNTVTSQNLNDAITAVASIGDNAWVSQPKRILLLEDSYTLSLLLSDALLSAGNEVDHVAIADEALVLARSCRHDFIIVAQNDTASISCTQLIERLRIAQRKLATRIPIAVLTSNAAPQNVQALRQAGADMVLTRDADQLAQQLVSWVQRGIPTTANTDVDTVPTLRDPLATQDDRTITDSGEDPDTESAAQPNVGRPWLIEPRRAAARYLGRSPAAAKEASTKPRDWWSTASMLGALVLSVGTAWLAWEYVADKTPVEVTTAKLGSVSHAIAVTGQVVSKRQIDLPATQAGQLYRVYVEEGQFVRKGEKLATLDNREALINVRRAEAQVFRFRTEVEFAERALRNLKAIGDEGAASQMAFDLKESKTLSETQLRIAEQDLRAARLAVERLVIVAPFAGVTVRSHATEGRWVEAGQPVYTLADLDTLEVALQIEHEDETQSASNIQVGQTAHLNTNGSEWSEKIQRIRDDRDSNVPAGSANQTSKQYRATAYTSVSDDAPALLLGQSISGAIVTDVASNSVTVPSESVVRRDGKDYVAVVEDGKVHYSPVEVGVGSFTMVAINAGLQAGEHVILPRQSLEGGQRVAPTFVESGRGAETETYPHRERFPDVAVYSTAELRQRYDDAHIVDVRSQFEYDVVHIAKAVNIPLSDGEFLARLEKLRAKNGTTPIVFYCNGHSCAKSYEAVREASKDGFGEVVAYDSGIFDWMREQHVRTTLLGITPAPVSKMVSEDYFQGRLIAYEQLEKKAREANTLVVDVRDARQRTSALPLPSVDVPLDDFVRRLDGDEFRDKQLLIVDAVGKQVRWLQYVLENKGHKNYFFLRNGVEGIKKP